MTEFTEPAYYGMDVDAELARYEREDRKRAEEQRASAARGTSARAPLGKGLRASLSLTGKEAPSLQSPLAA